MSNKKQTAVEFLFEQVCNLDWKNLIGETKKDIFEKAKQLEKEQIMEAYVNGAPYGSERGKLCEQYYQETYGK